MVNIQSVFPTKHTDEDLDLSPESCTSAACSSEEDDSNAENKFHRKSLCICDNKVSSYSYSSRQQVEGVSNQCGEAVSQADINELSVNIKPWLNWTQ